MIENFTQGLVISFREGLEAFLIIVILLQFLRKTKNNNLIPSVWHGTGAGILGSVIIGGILLIISRIIGETDNTAKIWESAASLIAVALITTFIIWMIKHGTRLTQHIESKASLNLSKIGIFLLAMIMVLREGAEIAIFSFAGDYHILPIVLGGGMSAILAVLVYYSIVKIKIKTIFTITLGYLILQAGFLAGYSLHEGLSAAKSTEAISADNPVYTKAFDVSGTVMNHKEGAIGLPLYVAAGWYSKPEWIQFILQYGYTLALFGYWYVYDNRTKA